MLAGIGITLAFLPLAGSAGTVPMAVVDDPIAFGVAGGVAIVLMIAICAAPDRREIGANVNSSEYPDHKE